MPVRDQRFLNTNPHEEEHQRQAAGQVYAADGQQSGQGDDDQREIHDTEQKHRALRNYRLKKGTAGEFAQPKGESPAEGGLNGSTPVSASEGNGTASSSSSTATALKDPKHYRKFSADYCQRIEDPVNLHHGSCRQPTSRQLLDTCRVNVHCQGGTCFDDNQDMSGSQRLGNCLVSPCNDRPPTCDLQGRDFQDSHLHDCQGFLQKHQFRKSE